MAADLCLCLCLRVFVSAILGSCASGAERWAQRGLRALHSKIAPTLHTCKHTTMEIFADSSLVRLCLQRGISSDCDDDLLLCYISNDLWSWPEG